MVDTRNPLKLNLETKPRRSVRVLIRNRDRKWVTWQTVSSKREARNLCKWLVEMWPGEPIETMMFYITKEEA